MAYHIALSEEDYATLRAASTQSGEPIETLVHEAIVARFTSAQSRHQIGSYVYPTGELDTPEDDAEDERLAASVGPEKPWLSDIVMEDRGPR